jgi:hypothetical protein
MMASAEATFSVPVLARLTTRIAVLGTGKKKSTKTDTRTKEFEHAFASTKSNYLELLNTILVKHHIMNKEVTGNQSFRCKIQVPPAMYVPLQHII